MTISDENLKKLYRRYLEDTAATSREGCPDPGTILNIMRSPRGSNKTRKTLDHISQCFHCAQEFDFILETLRKESDLNKGIGTSVSELHIDNHSFSRIRKIRILIPVVVVFLVVIISAGYYFYRYFQEKEYRSANTTSIIIEHPIHKSVKLENLVFEWTKLKGVNYYKIEVFDESLLPIWKSDKLYSNKVKAPPQLIQKLAQNETYFWMVTAILPNGKILDSHLNDFFIKK
jgi:hypothetical protein